jgi:membrane protein required for colicin V production
MNWLDWVVVAVLAFAAVKGFSRGFIVELASLVAVVAGAWIAVRFSDRIIAAIGSPTDSTAIAFLVSFILVVVAVHLLARFLTTVVDIAQLGLPNKLAGVLLGALRALFTLSVAFNLLVGHTDGKAPSAEAREGSVLYGPVAAFAPLIVPELGGTKWVKNTLDRMQQEAERVFGE